QLAARPVAGKTATLGASSRRLAHPRPERAEAAFPLAPVRLPLCAPYCLRPARTHETRTNRPGRLGARRLPGGRRDAGGVPTPRARASGGTGERSLDRPGREASELPFLGHGRERRRLPAAAPGCRS